MLPKVPPRYPQAMRLGAGCALTNDTAAENPLSNTIGVVGRTHQCPTPITRGGLPLHYCTRKRLVTERLMGKARGRGDVPSFVEIGEAVAAIDDTTRL